MKPKTIIFAGMVMLAQQVLAEDCTKDGKFHWSTCYGIQHSAITAGLQGLAFLADPQLVAPAGALACAAFIYRETQGVKKGLFNGADRTLDWVAPCATAAAIVWGTADETWYPWFGEGEFGVGYLKRW